MRKTGLILIAISFVIPIYWFINLPARHETLAVISMYLGSISLVAMGINQLLATRIRGLEFIFGGLDRIYVLHKWLGVIALATAALHDTIDAEMEGLGKENFLTDLAETLGEIGFYGLMALVLISLIPFIPYKYWKFSHKFIGGIFAMAAFHYIFMLKPFALTDPLGLYVLAFCLLGIISYLYMLLLYTKVPRPHIYRVEQINEAGGATEIIFNPVNKGLTHKAGQFAFIGFKQAEFEALHPFTISQGPKDNKELRFTIKALGSYTKALGNRLEVGTQARVFGPYGHFTERQTSNPQIWIAAGIGITPFLAWMSSYGVGKSIQPTQLFYCIRGEQEAPHLNEVKRYVDTIEGLELILVDSTKGSRLSSKMIGQYSGNNLQNHHVYFCGPVSLRRSLKEGLQLFKLKPNHFHYEEFQLRSSIGIRWIASIIRKIYNRS